MRRNGGAPTPHSHDDVGVDDEDYARELFEILTRPLDPDEPVDSYGTGSDGIDRFGGFGTEVRVTSVDVVPGPHGDQIEVGFVLAVDPDRPPAAPAHGSLRLPFAAEWRAAHGFAYPALHAPWVASAVMGNLHRHVSTHAPGSEARWDVPDRATQWTLLLERLGHEGEATGVAPGRIVVRRRGIADLTVVLTAEEWERVLRRHGSPTVGIVDFYDELLASGGADEVFLVFWEGDLVRSVREELPPVSGAIRMISAIQAARDRGEEPFPGAYWSLGPPRAD